jgi:hypothetical protein
VGEGQDFDRIGGERDAIGCVLGTRVSWWCVLDLNGGRWVDGRKREVPEAGVGRTGTGDDGAAVVGDVDGMGVEGGNATSVAKLAHRNEGAGCQVGENVGGKGEIREIEFGRVARVHDLAIG